ncbi:MAG: protein kinase domain-containing protein [Planctomycetaceae bacterium]|jgi:serine/threonine protein kinase/formylglycine-generating enzyme required for sulfatase activity
MTSPPEVPGSRADSSADSHERFEQLIAEFRQGWRDGRRIPIENLLDRVAPQDSETALRRLLAAELELYQESREPTELTDYQRRFPEYSSLVTEVFSEWDVEATQIAPSVDEDVGPDQTIRETPAADHPVQKTTSSPGNSGDDITPPQIEHFEIRRRLGKGGFGLVYLAFDPLLQRQVAIKVPRPGREQATARAWLEEARLVARLDHPHIVPVYQVGSTPGIAAYIVSKYIDGMTVEQRLRAGSFSMVEAVRLVRDVAGALDYAHHAPEGVIHRDIKPANLLLDHQGKVFVTDFGLAMRDGDEGLQTGAMGTPAYMSPEQANFEGHLVDGRTDIFSLGVVLYELLSGRRPFTGVETTAVLDQVRRCKPRPLRYWTERIPHRLEEICIRSMARLPEDRYPTAADLRDDLQDCLDRFLTPPESRVGAVPGLSVAPQVPETAVAGPTAGVSSAEPIGPASAAPNREGTAAPIVPKGLRSFDENDADFFLQLLPGPKDRQGLPQVLRYWKQKIEEPVGDRMVRVGLLFGPSGCGKSSLVKAGLLPRLSRRIHVIHLDSDPQTTEARLLKRLTGEFPELRGLGLTEGLRRLRRAGDLGEGRKLLIVLDQFEQWLNHPRDDEGTVLIDALRQCDGEHVQGLLLVRDDFALSAFRFQKELGIEQREEMQPVDLFDMDHAAAVLMACGQAYGKLPASAADLSAEQRQFLQRAVDGLAQRGRVVPVRLALFAEMFKHRPWTLGELDSVGGISGVGVTFLEETFAARSAAPNHRQHARGAKAVLGQLLPEAGTEIRGHTCSLSELKDASGYGNDPAGFRELLRILDADLRLITPVENDPDDAQSGESQARQTGQYQLTHDYLVPALREWLNRDQSPEARASRLLAERTALWTSRREDRHLPSLWEEITIRRRTDPRRRSAAERALLQRSARFHAVRGLLSVAGLLVLGLAALWLWQDRRQRTALALVERLEAAQPDEWNRVFEEIQQNDLTRQAEQHLREHLDSAAAEETGRVLRLRVGLWSAARDRSQIPQLIPELLTVSRGEFTVLRDRLASGVGSPEQQWLWQAALDPARKPRDRFQASAALARFAPDDSRWPELAPPVVEHLLSLPASELVAWRPQFDNVRSVLAREVVTRLQSEGLDPAVRPAATETLADFGREQGALVAGVMLHSDLRTFETLLPVAVANRDAALDLWRKELELPPDPELSVSGREQLASRQGRAAAGLAHLGAASEVWHLLAFQPRADQPDSEDPSRRTEIQHSFVECRVDYQLVVEELRRLLVTEPGADSGNRQAPLLRGLLQTLGGYTPLLSPATCAQLTTELGLQQIFETHTDSGVHGACEWLLRKWGAAEAIKATQTRLAQSGPGGTEPPRVAPGGWFVNSQGQTFAVFGPGEFWMGLSVGDRPHSQYEVRHRHRIDRPFAMSTTEVTTGQFAQYAQDKGIQPPASHWGPAEDLPQTSMTWFHAVQYCNWLSAREGLNACYRIDESNGQVQVQMEADFMDRDGYRLPTEAEWEYACRAGTSTNRFYGTSKSRLRSYAWYRENSVDPTQPLPPETPNDEIQTELQRSARAWPVGQLCPNEAGLFDMLGNAMEWCQERRVEIPTQPTPLSTLLDTELVVELVHSRTARGGAFNYSSSYNRCWYSFVLRPEMADYTLTFRPVRTWR